MADLVILLAPPLAAVPKGRAADGPHQTSMRPKPNAQLHPGWLTTFREDTHPHKVRSIPVHTPLKLMLWTAHLPKGYVTAHRAALHHYMVTEVGTRHNRRGLTKQKT